MSSDDDKKRKLGSIAQFPAPPGLRAAKMRGPEGELVVLSRPLPEAALPESLTAAEADVTRRIVGGETNEEISRARGTSLHTVANQVASIFRKFGVTSRSELVARIYAALE